MPSTPRPSRRSGRSLLPVLLSALAGCSDGTGSGDPLVGIWSLSAINGAPPPWTEPGWGVPVYVTDSDLGLSGSAAGGEGAVVVCQRFLHPAGEQLVTHYDRLTFSRSGASIVLRYRDDPSRPSETATLDGETLTVQRERENDRPVFTYVRVSSQPRQLTECPL